MAASRHPSRALTSASQDSTSTSISQNAALLGASTAFKRPAPKAKAPVNTFAGANGALAAATTTGTSSKPPSPQHDETKLPLFSNAIGESSRNIQSAAGNIAPLRIGAAPNLSIPPQSQRAHAKSPSQQAAKLAAARASPSMSTSPEHIPMSRKPAVAPKPRRFSGYPNRDEAILDTPTDSTSIANTNSLVNLFERKSTDLRPLSRRPDPIVIKTAEDVAIRSPKPVRTSGGITSIYRLELDDMQRASTAEGREFPNSNALEKTTTLASTDSYTTAPEETAVKGHSTIERGRTSFSSTTSGHALGTGSSPAVRSRSSYRHSPPKAISKPKLPLRTMTSPSELFPAYAASAKSLPAQYKQLHPPKLPPSLTGDQLANAMVAGSLASSRAPSPRRVEPPPLPPGRRHKLQDNLPFSRTPSPSKTGMRHTLRKSETDSSDDEDGLHPYGKHKKKRLVRKHPNKHHEGDRKRWRDAVTQRERTRYEGLWAANRGIHCSFTTAEESSFRQAPTAPRTRHTREDVSEQVSNIIVRDIWSRSKLPETVLETVWDLVDNACVGRLSKEEFVVGTWLIDQRLKGRKLPVKVGDSVWASVKGLQGIKIRK